MLFTKKKEKEVNKNVKKTCIFIRGEVSSFADFQSDSRDQKFLVKTSRTEERTITFPVRGSNILVFSAEIHQEISHPTTVLNKKHCS
jgi:hypothetical protein